MEKAGLYDSQAGIKISRTNINNLRYADVQISTTSDMQMSPPEEQKVKRN